MSHDVNRSGDFCLSACGDGVLQNRPGVSSVASVVIYRTGCSHDGTVHLGVSHDARAKDDQRASQNPAAIYLPDSRRASLSEVCKGVGRRGNGSWDCGGQVSHEHIPGHSYPYDLVPVPGHISPDDFGVEMARRRKVLSQAILFDRLAVLASGENDLEARLRANRTERDGIMAQLRMWHNCIIFDQECRGKP